MGDAGPPTPPPSLAPDVESVGGIAENHDTPLKEIKVLVTGFGVGTFSLSLGESSFPDTVRTLSLLEGLDQVHFRCEPCNAAMRARWLFPFRAFPCETWMVGTRCCAPIGLIEIMNWTVSQYRGV